MLGLSCPSTSVCYATDFYGFVEKTTDGGASWSFSNTPASLGTGLLTKISCSDVNHCVAVGPDYAGGNAWIVVTTDGGTTWTQDTSGTASGLYGVSCLPSTTTCFAVGSGGVILTTTDMVSWSPMTSATTNFLNGISCVSSTVCYAVGQNDTVDVLSGTTWTPSTAIAGNTTFLADVTCTSSSACFASGTNGFTINTTNSGASWSQQAGGATTQTMNAVSCPSTTECVGVAAAGVIMRTLDGGQNWLAQTSGTSNALNGVSCPNTATCVAVRAATSGAPAVIAASTNANNAGGSTWTLQASNSGNGTANSLTAVSCRAPSTVACLAADANGKVDVNTDVTGAGSWALATTGNANALNGISCPAGATAASVDCYAVGATVPINVTGASWVGGTATITFAPQAVAPKVGSQVVITGINPTGYTGFTTGGVGGASAGSFLVTASTTSSLSYSLPLNPGAYVSGGTAALYATILNTANSGSSWSSQTSNVNESLNAVTCTDAQHCFAGGNVGTIESTSDGGVTWTQQGNPLSGPSSGFNAGIGRSGSNSILAVSALGCGLGFCLAGTGSSGNVLRTPVSPTAVRVASFKTRISHGWTYMTWRSTRKTAGFDVYQGTVRLNRRLVTSRTERYSFEIHRVVRGVRLVAIPLN